LPAKPGFPWLIAQAATYAGFTITRFGNHHFNKTITISERLPREDTNLASALNSLGFIYVRRMDYVAAKTRFNRAMSLTEGIAAAASRQLLAISAGVTQRTSGAGEDGVLSALEAAALDLRGTQLVVLSACETGMGDVKIGDGVFGLRRALVLAGAESQVTSLWQVDDKVTRDLMVDFYTRLQRGEGRGEALRNAELTIMRTAARAHPYFWASFIEVGDWRSVSGN
jgi:hypothetical protein